MAEKVLVKRFIDSSTGKPADALLRVKGGFVKPDEVEFSPVYKGNSNVKDRAAVESREKKVPLVFVDTTHPAYKKGATKSSPTS